MDLEKDSDKRSPEPSAMSECIEPMDADNDSTHTIDSEDSTSTVKQEKPPKSRDATASAEEKRPIEEEDLKEEDDQRASAEKESNLKEKMKVDSVKVEPKKEKREAGETKGPTRPSSTPPCNTGIIQWTHCILVATK